MSEHPSTSAEVSGLQAADNLPDEFHKSGTEIPQQLFEKDEIAQLEADDSHAGAVLGKLLGAFFVTLLLMMLGVNLWMRNKHAQVEAVGEATPRHEEAAAELHDRAQLFPQIPDSTPHHPEGK